MNPELPKLPKVRSGDEWGKRDCWYTKDFGHPEMPGSKEEEYFNKSVVEMDASLLESLTKLFQEQRQVTLEKRVDDLERLVRSLSWTVEKHSDAIQLFQGEVTPEPGEFEKWYASKDARKHAGKQVAYVLGKGVIASSDSLAELLEKVPENEDPEKLVFAFVEDA